MKPFITNMLVAVANRNNMQIVCNVAIGNICNAFVVSNGIEFVDRLTGNRRTVTTEMFLNETLIQQILKYGL